jgi:hypothetical protein
VGEQASENFIIKRYSGTGFRVSSRSMFDCFSSISEYGCSVVGTGVVPKEDVDHIHFRPLPAIPVLKKEGLGVFHRGSMCCFVH